PIYVGEPTAVARESAVILDEHRDAVRLGEFREAAQPVGRVAFLRLALAARACVHADRMAAERGRGFDPFVVVLDRAGARGRVRIAEIAFAVAHDQQALDPFAGRAPLELREEGPVARLVEEELVDVLDRLDAERALRERRER